MLVWLCVSIYKITKATTKKGIMVNKYKDLHFKQIIENNINFYVPDQRIISEWIGISNE